MTALQAIKLVLHYGSQDWAAWMALTNTDASSGPKSTLTAAINSEAPSSSLKKPIGTDEPPAPTPDKSIRFLNAEQMVAIAQCAKVRYTSSSPADPDHIGFTLLLIYFFFSDRFP